MIAGNIIGAILKNPRTLILRTEEGSEHAAAMTAEEVVLTADANDVRLGETFASQKGVETGDKFIPAYHTTEGFQVIPDGSEYRILLEDMDKYKFTKFQAIICDFNTSVDDSVSADKISVYEKLYSVRSIESLSTIVKNDATKAIEFGVENNTGKSQVLRYFTYKEI